MKAQHTPVPWKLYSVGNTVSVHYGDGPAGGDDCIVHWTGFDGSNVSLAKRKANAKFIVRACNSHDKLLAALESIMALEPSPDMPDRNQGIAEAQYYARAALAAAKGQS